jgi:hypothetical protein
MAEASNVALLAEQVLAATKLHDANPQDRAARLDALRKVERLQAQLEDPKEAMFRQFTDVKLPDVPMHWKKRSELTCRVPLQFSRTAALRAMLEFKVLEVIPRQGSMGAKELAAKSNVDEQVLSKFFQLFFFLGVYARRAHG